MHSMKNLFKKKLREQNFTKNGNTLLQFNGKKERKKERNKKKKKKPKKQTPICFMCTHQDRIVTSDNSLPAHQ